MDMNMMKTNTSRHRWLTCAALLATTLALPVAAQPAPAAAQAPASAASAAGAESAPTVRPEIGNLLVEAQRLLADDKGKEAADKLAAAEAVTNKTPYELHILALLKGALAALVDDVELAVQQYEVASQGPWLKQPDRATRLKVIASLYYNAKNYPKAIEWIARYHQAGGDDPTLQVVLAQSYYLNADYATAARLLDAEVKQTVAAGKTPAEIQIKLLADTKLRLKDQAGYTSAVETLVQYYPSQANWRALMARLWAKPQLASRLQLDVFRLQLASAGLSDESDYIEMASFALQEGSAIEASKLLEQGYAAGVLVAGGKPGELQRITDKVNKAAAEDRNTLEKDVARARTLPDGFALFNYGYSTFVLGQTERGVTLMEQALAKGFSRNTELARLRLVAAYAKLGQRDKANELLKALAGKSDPVGLDDCVRYWQLLLRRP